jgi:hypothetical protein
MTQQEKLEQVLTELGISYSKRESTPPPYVSEEGTAKTAPWDVSIDLTEGVGLPGHIASFYFDADESFLEHRIWKKQ